MPDNIGRLTVSRNEGESVAIDNVGVLTVSRVSKVDDRVELLIKKIDGTSRHWVMDSATVLHLSDKVQVQTNKRTPHSTQVRVTFTAPRDITIMRTELLDAPKRTLH